MPINVAMQEPGSWVIGEESESGVASIDGIDITTERVLEVEVHVIGWQDDIEGMTVQVEWMRSLTRNRHLNERVPRNNEDLFRWEKILRLLGTAEELKKDRDGRRDVRNAVDIEEGRVGLSDVECDSNIGGTISEFARTFSSDGMHLLVEQLVAGNVDRGRFYSLSTLVAQDSECKVRVEVRVVRRASTSGRSADPVVVDRLVGVKNSRDTLSSVDIDVLHRNRVVQDAVSLDEGDVVVINGESEEWTAGDRKDTETVSLALLDIDHSKWYLWSSVESTFTVDQARVLNRDNTGSEELVGTGRSQDMVPLSQGDDCGLIVNVIHRLHWVIGIVYDEGTAETITVLS